MVFPRIQSPTCLCPLDLGVAYCSDPEAPLWVTGAGWPLPGILEGPDGSVFEREDVVVEVAMLMVLFAISSGRDILRSTLEILPAGRRGLPGKPL